MVCKKCGSEIGENDMFCPNCKEYVSINEEKPKTIHRTPEVTYEEPNATLWIVLGILASIFCCLIGGIGTIVYAAKASGNISAGNLGLAEDNIATAKKWFIATVIIGIIGFAIGLIAY
ncbi:MAG: CD225/dispanin family protein [Oscillospiraceae bacterium]|nr:CD225/dispanin family protein [Oscillospiraceae bacterium]